MRISDYLGRASRIFLRDQRANFAIMFALTAPILILFVGMGVDYLVGLSTKARWDTAADAAALAAVQAAEAYVKANAATAKSVTDLSDGAVAAGEAQGLKSFNANAGASESTEQVTPTVTMPPLSGATFTATASYSGTVGTHFGGLVGISTISASGTAVATATMTAYINYYIAVDVSQSMGIGSTATDQTNLFNLLYSMNIVEEGERGCVFGCHVPVNGSQAGVWHSPLPDSNEYLAHNASPPITLRIDAAKTAIMDVLSQAKPYMGNGGNLKIALYTIQASIPSTPAGSVLSTLSSLSNDYATLDTAAGAIDLGPNTSQGLGDTDLITALSDLSNEIPTNGNGFSPASPLNYVLLITDGMVDTYCPLVWNGHCSSAITATACSGLQANATVGVVYTTYPPIYANNNPADGYETNYSSLIEPYAADLEPNLQACASNASLFYEATDGPALVADLQSLFQSTLPAPNRLTQ